MSSPRRRPLLRALAWTAGAALLLVAATAGWGWWRMRSALPVLDGNAPLHGLSAPVTVERDHLGVPTIQAQGEADAYRALGFLHAQDRFFQMDLSRRRADGRLAELFGRRALEMDRWAARMDFRAHAAAACAALPADQRLLLEAYAEGVNAGLASLASPPWEYAVLRSAPRPWSPVDSLLCGFAMVTELEDGGDYERRLALLRDTLGQDATDFLAPLLSPEDAPLDGSVQPLPRPPARDHINLRRGLEGDLSFLSAPAEPFRRLLSPLPVEGAGSNAMAVSGEHAAAGGAALVAGDMHLHLGIPNTWYRAVLSWPAGTEKDARPLTLSGLTLPGVPMLICGSNGSVAWSFTVAYADTADLVLVEEDPLDPTQYRVGTEWVKFEKRSREIRVGDETEHYEYRVSRWGPIIGPAGQRRHYALLWTALSADAVDLAFTRMARVTDAASAARLGAACGLPALNMIAGDRRGAIAWTVAGRLPERRGYSGRFPIPHTDGDRQWLGTLPAERHPLILSPASGFLGSSNERLFGGETLAVLGDGGHESGARGRQLRGDLAELCGRPPGSLRPPDLLAVQLDDRALALTRWRTRLLALLGDEALAGHPARAALKDVVKNWIPKADAASAGYRLVREFRDEVSSLALGPLLVPCREADPGFRTHGFRTEAALWRLLEDKPAHLLRPRYESWESLELEAVDQVLERVGDPAHATWGSRNRARIRHPFGLLLPDFAASWLGMPPDELDGDKDMPRVASPDFGASERFVVAPGLEAEGIMHMPGGQSGNPLSPFFSAGHEDWVHGRDTYFLPGTAEHRIQLSPH
jgi:penicillin amidase